MFPNPQDAFPLPPRPNVERYKKLAKDLLEACKSSHREDHTAISKWAEKYVNSLARFFITKQNLPRLQAVIDRRIGQIEEFAVRKLCGTDGKCRLTETQFVIARAHGFESWTRFIKHIEALSGRTSSTARFETAADAIVSGNLKTLKRLLREDQKLVRVRSTREHRSTLLHYVSANGVEGYRQKTPKNAIEITRALLEAGADVNAEADVYGGRATSLGLVGTSIHPLRAGVQNQLLGILIQHGAEIDHPEAAGTSPAVMGALANGCGDAAIYLAEHGAKLDLETAGGVGRLDIIEKAFNKDGAVKKSVRRRELVSSFLYACAWGRNNVVEFMLKKGIKPGVHRGDGQTATHWAVIGGQLDTLKLLLKQEPNLEVINMYGGSVLGQTLWSAAHGGDPVVYAEIIKTLIAAGAKLRARHVPVNPPIDELLRSYGSEPEPTWYWFGEKPRKKG